ncbi:MAG: Abscisic acid G-protein coupled receptor-domain-containing protein, partial [Olpidium bornovanus]
MFHSVASNIGFGGENLGQLQAEVNALELLGRQLFVDIDELYAEKERLEYAKTWKGKYYNFLGYIFSVYCVYKVIMVSGIPRDSADRGEGRENGARGIAGTAGPFNRAPRSDEDPAPDFFLPVLNREPSPKATVNIVFNRIGKTDPVTYGITLVAVHLNVSLDVHFWSQNLSFLTVGLMVLFSIRGMLIQLMKFFRVLASAVSAANVVLFLAQIMGMYFLSSVVLTRMSLPLEYRSIITEVLGDIEFHFYHRWFDVIFLLSAIASV